MIDKYQALKIAQEYLDKQENQVEVLVDEDSFIEKENGWVIFYQLKEYYLSKDKSFLLVGNVPIFVSKMDGLVAYFPSERKNWVSKIHKSFMQK